jgi:putative restriction endonuclease
MNGYLFVKTGWAREYRDLDSDEPRSYHGWLAQNAGHEAFNFKPSEGRVYGYFPFASESGGPDLGRIVPGSTGDRLDGVTVVWTATDPDEGGTKVVGWYRNATVYDRAREDSPWTHPRLTDIPGGRVLYVCTAREADSHVVPVGDRVNWPLPPRVIPQANLRYPTSDDYADLNLPWAIGILDRIAAFSMGASSERSRRDEMWSELQRSGDTEAVAKSLMRELGGYGGASGIWVDASRTRGLTTDGNGVTVSVLHTGRSYPDDLSEDSLIYHFPRTERPGRDDAEIAATKNAARLGLPILALLPSRDPSAHRVRRGWVRSWDDETRTFLIQFGPEVSPSQFDGGEDESAFNPLAPRAPRRQGQVLQRPDQAAFKFEVEKIYGAACAVCDLSVQQVLDAAHIVPDREGGVAHWRNGLVLCATHHRAYDAGLFDIDPESLRLEARNGGPGLVSQKIHRTDIAHLRRKPATEALRWRWSRRLGSGTGSAESL